MRKKLASVLALLLFSFSVTVDAEEAQYEPSSDVPLQQTKQVLRSRSARRKIIRENEKAQQADSTAKEVMGENVEDMYQVSAEMMQMLTTQTKGDPEKMQQMIDLASRNPAAFLENLPPEYKDKITALADKSALNKKNP